MIVGETATTVVSVTVVWVRNDISRAPELMVRKRGVDGLRIGSQVYVENDKRTNSVLDELGWIELNVIFASAFSQLKLQ
jgi:hypothetical protein